MYRAWDFICEQYTALKKFEILVAEGQREVSLQSFQQEHESQRMIKHPNVVEILGWIERILYVYH